MKLTKALLAAASCSALAACIMGNALAQTKPQLDANGTPCINGDLDNSRQCLIRGTTTSTPDHPYRNNSNLKGMNIRENYNELFLPDGRANGTGRGFIQTGARLIFAAVPGSIVVLNADDNYNFVKRIVFEDHPASIRPESVSGMMASPATNMIYVATRGHLIAIDLFTDKVVWKNSYEPGTCCERGQVTPDGLTLDVGSNLQDFHRVIDAKTGVVKGIIRSPLSMFNHNVGLSPDGKTVFIAPNGLTMTVADMNTMKATKTITFSDHIRVFVLNHDASRIYSGLNNLLGFEIADVKSGKVIKRVEVPGEMWKDKWADPNLYFHGHGAPMHGIAMTPDESEIWIPDAINDQVLVFDNTGEWPVLNLNKTIKTELPNGWITIGLDGKLAYMCSGDVVDVKTHKIVGKLRDEFGRFMNSEKVLDMQFDRSGRLLRTVNEFSGGHPKAYQARIASEKKIAEKPTR
jgi:hypothetical protein